MEPSDTPPVDAELAEELEAGRLLFSKPCEFILGAAQLEQIPDSSLSEIAFAGRSNVGKSSLINALTGHKALARTSNTPGRTQQINFFTLGNRLMIADLPGYGYARAPKEQVREWTEMVNAYLRGRQELRRVCLLIDARHGIKESDREVMKMLDTAAQSYQVFLTKCDKINESKLKSLIESIEKELRTHTAAHPEILTTSSAKKFGIAEARGALAKLAG